MSKVLWHLTMSLDGFIAGPGHSMDWMAGLSFRPGIVEESIANLGAILAGRRGYDAGIEAGLDVSKSAYGGLFIGPIFVLTHHPEDAGTREGLTFINTDVRTAVATGLDAAGGKDLEIFGADIARQALAEGLIDEFRVHLAPVMIGDGIRLYDSPGTPPVRWHRIHDGDPTDVLDLRYRPAR